MNGPPLRSRRLIGISAAAAAAVLVAGGTAYFYFFSGLRTAPQPLAPVANAGSPAPVGSAAPGPAATADAGSTLTGGYAVGEGSVVGYRVREQFAGQASPHEAVSRTSSVTGGVTVGGPAGQLEATSLKFAAQLAGLSSVDQVAGFNVTQRDRLVQSSLGVSQFPTATFEATTVQLPAALLAGNPAQVTVPGRLTLHGVTRQVEVAAQLQVKDGKVTVAGSVPVNMADYGVSPPRAPFATPESQAIIEFQLVLSKN